MAGKMTAAFAIFALFALLNCGYVRTNPAIATVYDPLTVCFQNCAQCEKMYKLWFNGPLCADACIRLNGKLMPECENIDSIRPYLNLNLNQI